MRPWMRPMHELGKAPVSRRAEHAIGLFRADLGPQLDHLAGQFHAVAEPIKHLMLPVCQGDIVLRCRDIRRNVPAMSLLWHGFMSLQGRSFLDSVVDGADPRGRIRVGVRRTPPGLRKGLSPPSLKQT